MPTLPIDPFDPWYAPPPVPVARSTRASLDPAGTTTGPPAVALWRPFRLDALPAPLAIRPLLHTIGCAADATAPDVRAWIGHADERVHLVVLRRHGRAVMGLPWSRNWLWDLLVAQAFAAAAEEGMLWTPLLEALARANWTRTWLRPWARSLVELRRWIRGTSDTAGLRLLLRSTIASVRTAAAAQLFLVLPADKERLWRLSNSGRALNTTLHRVFAPSCAVKASPDHLAVAGRCIATALRQQAVGFPTSWGTSVTARAPWDIDGSRRNPTPWREINRLARRDLYAAARNPRAYAHAGAVAALRRWGVKIP